ncbi:MAG: hypothetical protein AAB922_05925 [Patescibacteria group bacterium]
MSETAFWEKQFAKYGVPKGSGKYENFELCKRLIQRQSKLSPQVYAESLKIAREYCGV